MPAGTELSAELGYGCIEDVQAAALPCQGWAAGRSPAAASMSWKGFAHPPVPSEHGAELVVRVALQESCC